MSEALPIQHGESRQAGTEVRFVALTREGFCRAAEFSVSSETPRFMDVITNSFCAGGIVLGNGTWLNVGGNQPVGVDGLTVLTGV